MVCLPPYFRGIEEEGLPDHRAQHRGGNHGPGSLGRDDGLRPHYGDAERTDR